MNGRQIAALIVGIVLLCLTSAAVNRWLEIVWVAPPALNIVRSFAVGWGIGRLGASPLYDIILLLRTRDGSR